MKTYYRLILEAIAIIGSVLFSFYIEDLRKKSDNLILKNALIGDLIETIEDDLTDQPEIYQAFFARQKTTRKNIFLYKIFFNSVTIK